jgi:uncharacterized membrane protein
VSLGDVVGGASAEAFTGSAVAATTVQVLDLVRGAAVVADGDHLVSTTAPVEVTPAGATTAIVTLSLVEAPRRAWGPPDPVNHSTAARTAQIDTTVTLTVPVSVPGVGDFEVTFDLSVRGGGGEAFLTGVDCSGTTPTNVDVLGTTRTLQAAVGAFAAVSVDGLLTVTRQADAPVQSEGSAGSFGFPDPFDQVHTVGPDNRIMPTVDPSTLQVVGTTLDSTTGLVTDEVASRVNAVLDQVDDLLAPLYEATGVGWSDADLRVLHPTPNGSGIANGPAPVCSAVTTTSSTTTTTPGSTGTPGGGSIPGTSSTLGTTPRLVE